MGNVSDRHEQSASAKALAVLRVLREASANCPEGAITDGQIAKRAHVSKRKVIDLAKELAEKSGIAVLATCGPVRQGIRSKGRYVEGDSMKVRAYGERLHKRAAHIHDRGWTYKRLADRMDSEVPVASGGQRSLFA